MNPQKTGELIASARRELGLTQEQLADRLHLSHTTVSKWERGQGFPEVSLLEPLSAVLGLTLDELFAGERLPKQQTTYVGRGKLVFDFLNYPDAPEEKGSEEASPEDASAESSPHNEEALPAALPAKKAPSRWRAPALCLLVVVVFCLIGLLQKISPTRQNISGDPTRLEGTWRFVPVDDRLNGRRGIPSDLYLGLDFPEYVHLQANISHSENDFSIEEPYFSLCIGAYQVDEGRWEDLGGGRYRLTGELLETEIQLEIGKTQDRRTSMGYCYLTLPGVEKPILLVKCGDPDQFLFIPQAEGDPYYNPRERESLRQLLRP